MGYEILILILPLLVYGVYQDLKDAHKIPCQPGTKRSIFKMLKGKPFFDTRSGPHFLIFGFLAVCA
jgi:hypothetical protein